MAFKAIRLQIYLHCVAIPTRTGNVIEIQTATILEDLSVMTSAHSASCPKLLKSCRLLRLQLAWVCHNLGKTCLKLHSILISPLYVCVSMCVYRYLKFDIASIVQFMANLLSAKTGAVQCNCLSVWLRAQRIYDSLSYWNEYLFAFIVYSYLWQGQHPSVCPKMEQRCQQCWLLDAHCQGRRTD